MTDEIVEAEVIAEHDEASTDLAIRPETTQQIVRADTPREFIAKTTEIATALADVVNQRNLFSTIQGKKHVQVEGWTLLGSMMGAFGTGVYASTEWTRPVLDGDVQIGYEARVVARTTEGAQVGAAEAMCTRRESRWRTADDYAIRSMAQTRATSKALRMPLGFIMQLAGYSATPTEEMDGVVHTPPAAPVSSVGVSAGTLARLEKGVGMLHGTAGWSLPEVVAQASRTYGRNIGRLADLSEKEAGQVLEAMKTYGGIEP